MINSEVVVLLFALSIENFELEIGLCSKYCVPKYLSKMDTFAWKNLKLVTYHSSVKSQWSKNLFLYHIFSNLDNLGQKLIHFKPRWSKSPYPNYILFSQKTEDTTKLTKSNTKNLSSSDQSQHSSTGSTYQTNLRLKIINFWSRPDLIW